jgi:Domain of unknown function (DUF4263)
MNETAYPSRIVLVGFCDRAEEITQGHPIFWRWNLLGVSLSRAFFAFPVNLRGSILAVAVFQPKAGESLKVVFRGADGKSAFDISITISSFSEIKTSQNTKSTTEHKEGVATQGWAFVPNRIEGDIIVNEPGSYRGFAVSEGHEQYIGDVTFANLVVPPYSSEEITAIKSDPLARKLIKADISCNSCKDRFKAYAGLDRSSKLEAEGYRWNLDLEQSHFICVCGKTQISLQSIKTGLHGLLRRNLDTEHVSAVRLYEETALEQACAELLGLVGTETTEERIQTFLESHPIFFHIFVPKKIIFKPPILTKFVADFGVLNNRNELLLIEIEKPHLRMTKKDGDITAELGHAFYQVRTWTQVINDHRAAALDAISLKLDEVARVRGVVIAGRKPGDEKQLRLLRAVSTSDIELFTYDDLIGSVAELTRRIANT